MDEIVNVDVVGVDKLLVDSKSDSDCIFDEKARSEYVAAIAKIYDAKVREKELEVNKLNREFENQLKLKELENDRKAKRNENIVRGIDAFLKFVGTAASVVIPAGVYLKCWQEGMKFEETGVFTSSTFKDLKRSIKLKW